MINNDNMEIKVLGTGCSRCKTLLMTVEQVVSENGLDATITKVNDIQRIIEYKVMGLPALVVDQKVLSAGKTLSKDEIKKLLIP